MKKKSSKNWLAMLWKFLLEKTRKTRPCYAGIPDQKTEFLRKKNRS